MQQTTTKSLKTCNLCGASFSCNPTACWCFGLPPVMPVTGMAGDCHCPACLQNLINQKHAYAATAPYITVAVTENNI